MEAHSGTKFQATGLGKALKCDDIAGRSYLAGWVLRVL